MRIERRTANVKSIEGWALKKRLDICFTYKQMFLKSCDGVNYDLKGTTKTSAGGARARRSAVCTG